jgi:hypothetical protein
MDAVAVALNNLAIAMENLANAPPPAAIPPGVPYVPPAPGEGEITYPMPVPLPVPIPEIPPVKVPETNPAFVAWQEEWANVFEEWRNVGDTPDEDQFDPNAWLAAHPMPTMFLGEGGLANSLAFAGEKGPEWVVPTYEPQRSRFLSSAPSEFWENISGGQENREVTVHSHIYLDGKVVAENVAKHIPKNSSLNEAIRRVKR